MHNISTLDLCRQHLLTAQEDIIAQFCEAAAERVMLVREMYKWFIANLDATDREFVSEVCQHHGIHRTDGTNAFDTF